MSFLHMIPWQMKEGNNKLDYTKVRNACSLKVLLRDQNAGYRPGENIYNIHICKGQVSKIYKELWKLNNKGGEHRLKKMGKNQGPWHEYLCIHRID